MSIYKFFASAGALAGVGFGIYAAVQNFNPDEHQSESMTEATRVFSELMIQTGYIGLYATSLSFYCGVAGAILDCVTCGKFVSSEEKDGLKEQAKSMSPV